VRRRFNVSFLLLLAVGLVGCEGGPSSKPAPAAQLPIRIAAGVALPQTGPEGTLMSFSVDYEFAEGEPATAGYTWVIERAHGAAAKQKVQLKKQGNLMTLVPGWRPEDGPFKSHIEDLKGNPVSESLEMR
jgi:hypothetical protein